MRKFLFAACAIATLITGHITTNFATTNFATTHAAIAQTPTRPSATRPRPIIDTLASSCTRALEISYRSRSLVSRNGNTQVHFNGFIRRLLNGPAEDYSADYCFPNKIEMLENDLVMEAQGGVQRIDQGTGTGYVITHPVSFSVGDRYLAANTEIISGFHSKIIADFFDLTNGARIQISNICEGLNETIYDDIEYVGFISATEAVVECQPGGGRQPTPSRFELVNLQTQTSQPLTEQPANAVSYGTIVGELEITKTQIFE